MGEGSRTHSEQQCKDFEALLAARRGDHEAGRYLMSHHGPSMVKTAWRVLGRYGVSEAEDVVQEAFIAALTTSALPRTNPGAWLRAITVRKALDWLRRVGRLREQPIEEAGEYLSGLVSSQNPASALDVVSVRRGLAQLSASDRAVLTLVDLEGHSMAEAAQALGVTRVAVRLRAVRARRKLARLLGGHERSRQGPHGERTSDEGEVCRKKGSSKAIGDHWLGRRSGERPRDASPIWADSSKQYLK